MHEYLPDFIIRLKTAKETYLLLEVKGHDELAEVKRQAAIRWCGAVTTDLRYGRWLFDLVREPSQVRSAVARAVILSQS